mgnify:FL=1
MNAHMRSLWIGGAVLAAGAMATPALAEDPYELAWISQIGTSGHDISRSVALDSLGNVYISGGTTGNLAAVNVGGIDDLFLSKFDAAGNHLWSQQIGTLQSDRSYSVAIDGLGNPYISGFTDGNIAKPSNSNHDVVLIKYDSAGNHLWSQQIGTGNGDVSLSLAVDVVGNAWISGYSNGDLGGPNAGNSDAILAKFDAAGNHLWTQQFGTSSLDLGTAVAVDHLGNAYISGPTLGSLGGPNAGQSTVWRWTL